MQEHNQLCDNSLTERQWARKGFLLKEGALGTLLWSNCYHYNQFRYYRPEEVRPATKDELRMFFRPERERHNQLARQRRVQRIERDRAEKEDEEYWRKLREQYRVQQIVCRSIHPLLVQMEHMKSRYSAVVIDTETTGLSPIYHEILQLSIVSINGEVLFDSYFKPVAESWDSAQAVNGISPGMVKDAPTLAEKIAEISEILYFCDEIIGYNV